MRDGLLELGRRGAGAAVEHEEGGLVVLDLELLLEVGLVLAEAERGVLADRSPAPWDAQGGENLQLGVEPDVAGLVDAVDVAEASSDGEVGGDGGESAVHLPDVLGLSVERVVVDVLVVDAILLTTGDTYVGRSALLWGSFSMGPTYRSPSRATASWAQRA